MFLKYEGFLLWWREGSVSVWVWVGVWVWVWVWAATRSAWALGSWSLTLLLVQH